MVRFVLGSFDQRARLFEKKSSALTPKPPETLSRSERSPLRGIPDPEEAIRIHSTAEFCYFFFELGLVCGPGLPRVAFVSAGLLGGVLAGGLVARWGFD